MLQKNCIYYVKAFIDQANKSFIIFIITIYIYL